MAVKSKVSGEYIGSEIELQRWVGDAEKKQGAAPTK